MSRNIAVLWQDDVDLTGEAPFERGVKNEDYRTFTELAGEAGLDVYVARLEWYSHGRLREAWHWDGGWQLSEDVSLDGAIDRFAFTDATERIKQAIEDEVATLNDFRIKKICRDKWQTYQLFGEYMPETRKATKETVEAMLAEAGKVVLKPRYGAGGDGIEIIEDIEAFEPQEDLLVQRYIPLEGIEDLGIDGPHDLRVAVVDGEVKVSYIRTNDEGDLANISQGGGDVVYIDTGDLPRPIPTIVEEVNEAFQQFQPCIYTIDFVFGPRDEPYLIECNTKPPFGYHREIQDREQELPLIESVIAAMDERTQR